MRNYFWVRISSRNFTARGSGHRDRGCGVASNIAALEAGATRLYGAALGIGERCGW